MITGVVLARNEEINIVEALEALRPWVDELILIDMESEDRTIELARPMVDVLLTHPLQANFDSARNDAIPIAANEWLWFVDADERVSRQVGETVRKLIAEQGETFEAMLIPFKSYFCGQWMQHCGWWPGYTMPRVLKRGSFRFSERLHGGVELSGRQVRLPADEHFGIDHFSYRSVAHYIDKFNRYTSTEAAQLSAGGAVWDWRVATKEMMHDLWTYYERNPGVHDGDRGFILSWLSGQYRWLSRAKLIDVATASTPQLPNSIPASLDELLQLMKQELDSYRSLTPQLPLGLLWRSPLLDSSGYADESRAFVKAIATSKRHFKLEEIRWNDDSCQLPTSDAALIRALLRSEPAASFIGITDCIPTLVEPIADANRNVIRTTFETDRIPAHWLPRLDAFDEIWVPSQQNYRAFRRSGVAPERLRVVASCYDENLFCPHGLRFALPTIAQGRFVFLSVFDWQLRKGWDLLLRGYAREFNSQEATCLVMKITRSHNCTLAQVHSQANSVLEEYGQSLASRPDILIWDQTFTAEEMAALYRSVSAFVLPSRGEGWGRPYMEAMASGLPTIGTMHLGSADFMTAENSYLVPASLVPVPEAASNEIVVYCGHKWFEPDLGSLKLTMRHVAGDSHDRASRAGKAVTMLPVQFGLSSGCRSVLTRVAAIEKEIASPALPAATDKQLRVVLEGEFFAAHSFSNINEQLAMHFVRDEHIALSLIRKQYQPTFDQRSPLSHALRPYFGRDISKADCTIRHAFPPNWDRVEHGLQIHIQPWEFGYLPSEWIEPLQNLVSEAWVPSQYVKKVFTDSGIPSDKVQVIPWGIDERVFNRDAEPLLLPTDKSFRFLFVGGLIERKGFDKLLEAYLQEFNRSDDVCLVVKDLGSNSFYRHANYLDQLLAAARNRSGPEIIVLSQLLTNGQLASLYRACHSLVAPYRAEGFGLPVLEAMACGIVPIITDGGPTDDFTSDNNSYRLASQTVETDHDWPLTGPPLVFDVSLQELKRTMRYAFTHRDDTERRGSDAAVVVRERYTWSHTVRSMKQRMIALVEPPIVPHELPPHFTTPLESPRTSSIAACLRVDRRDDLNVGHALSLLAPFVDELFVLFDPKDQRNAIGREYGAKVLEKCSTRTDLELLRHSATSDWVFLVGTDDHISEWHIEAMRRTASQQPTQAVQFAFDIFPASMSSAGSISAENRDQLQVFRRAL